VIEILEGDSSFVTVGASSMIMGSFEGGWGFPTLILVLLRDFKYINVYLFLFPFCLARVLSAARTTAASLASVSGDTSCCCFSSSSSAVLPVSVVPNFVYTISSVISSFSC